MLKIEDYHDYYPELRKYKDWSELTDLQRVKFFCKYGCCDGDTEHWINCENKDCFLHSMRRGKTSRKRKPLTQEQLIARKIQMQKINARSNRAKKEENAPFESALVSEQSKVNTTNLNCQEGELYEEVLNGNI